MSAKPNLAVEETAATAHHLEHKGNKHGTSEADRALEFAHHHGALSWTPAEEKRLLLKLDLMIIPLVRSRTAVELSPW